MLHVGGLRTALYNYLYAKQHNGVFVLRIEDTDQARFVEGAEQDIINALRWAGMDFDEGPGKEGDVGPYHQSKRSEIYKKYAEQLIEQDNAYYAFDTTEDIEEMRERLKKSGNPSPKYDAITRMSMKNSLTLSKEEVEERLSSGESYVVRLKVPRRETVRFEDEIRGFVSFETQGLDDQVLVKSDGLPTYHMANVVDDHLMNITHVIRGEEWLSSAPKHLLLYKYLGWEAPKMAHLPLIMSPSGGKLSKRKAESEGIPVNVKDYIAQQFEPHALVNFLAFLGWSPGNDKELFDMQELVDAFSLERVSKSGAIFNFKKLMWYNEHYLREKSAEELLPRVKSRMDENGVPGVDDEYLKEVIELFKERASKVTDFVDEGMYFFETPTEFDEKTAKKAWKEQTPEILGKFKDDIAELSDDEFTGPNVKEKAKAILDEKGLGFGKLAQPLRLAVSGIGYGPDLFSMVALLGKDEVIKRLEFAIETL
jgi:glutamyl-tRNA synthetase